MHHQNSGNILTPLRAIIEQALVDQYIKENPLIALLLISYLTTKLKKVITSLIHSVLMR